MTEQEHQHFLVRRRIKFVVEKGSMARLFKKGCHGNLQAELARRLQPEEISQIMSQKQYDKWLLTMLRLSSWKNFARSDGDAVRWGYFAKLVNIVIYELVSNREVFPDDAVWQRLRPFLHIPLDSKIMDRLAEEDPGFPTVSRLNKMTEAEYFAAQNAARAIAAWNHVAPIWFEAAWSA